eukprot:scaffold6536_cov83-Skeletonema_dohrnii-CCMP3373.AAC.5
MSDSCSSSGGGGSSVASDDVAYLDFTGNTFLDDLRRMREDDTVSKLVANGLFECIQDMTDDCWEQLGRDISNSNCLQDIEFSNCLNDHKMTFFFRGLTRSSSTRSLGLFGNGFGFSGVQSMVPFLQNANNLVDLNINYNNITPEGFNLLFRALRNSPIITLRACHCGLDAIEIDVDSIPNNLQSLLLIGNEIDADGCRGLAKLLQRENASLEQLLLGLNKIDDEGISILVNALRTNTSLKLIDLQNNVGLTLEGMKLLLNLVNDISSIKATLQSNHTLQGIICDDSFEGTDVVRKLKQILQININGAGREKVICTQLDSKLRAEMCSLQGIEHLGKPLTEIGPLLLPEVLEIVGNHHGLSGFYESFRTSLADLWTTINREVWLQQKIEEISQEIDVLATKKLELEKQREAFGVEVAEMRQQSAAVANDGSHSSKRPRMA